MRIGLVFPRKNGRDRGPGIGGEREAKVKEGEGVGMGKRGTVFRGGIFEMLNKMHGHDRAGMPRLSAMMVIRRKKMDTR